MAAKNNSVGGLSIILSGNATPLVRSMSQAQRQVKSLSDSVKNASGSGRSGGIFGPMLAANLVSSGLQSLGGMLVDVGKSALKMAADAELATVQFEVMMGSAKEGADMMKQIEKFAIASPYDSAGLTASARMLKTFGVENDQILPSLKALGDIASGDSVKLEQLALVFGQVKAQGRLMGADLTQFSNAGVGVKDFAETMGVTVSEFMKLKEAGQVTFDVVARTFNRLTGAGGRFFQMMQRQSGTVQGQWNALSENLQVTLRDTGLAFFKGFGVADLLARASDSTSGLRDRVKELVPVFAKAREAFDIFVSSFTAAGRVYLQFFGEFGSALAKGNLSWEEWKNIAWNAIESIAAGLGGLLNVLGTIADKLASNVLKPVADTLKAFGSGGPEGAAGRLAAGIQAGKHPAQLAAEEAVFGPVHDALGWLKQSLAGDELKKFEMVGNAAARMGQAMDAVAKDMSSTGVATRDWQAEALRAVQAARRATGVAKVAPDIAALGLGMAGPFGAMGAIASQMQGGGFLSTIKPMDTTGGLKSDVSKAVKSLEFSLPEAMARGSSGAESVITRAMTGQSGVWDAMRDLLAEGVILQRQSERELEKIAGAVAGGGIIGVNF